MKNTATNVKFHTSALLLAIFLLTGSLLSEITAQTYTLSTSIAEAIKSGSASKLALHFNESVDLTLPGREGAVSKKQAEQILKKFFEDYPVKGFVSDHTGNSDKGSCYLIGTYTSTSNEKFRVYLLIKNTNNTSLIQQIQFEKE